MKSNAGCSLSKLDASSSCSISQTMRELETMTFRKQKILNFEHAIFVANIFIYIASYLINCSDINEKIRILSVWHRNCADFNRSAGCLLIGYEAYRTLVSYHLSKKSKDTFPAEQLEKVRENVKEYMLDPGKRIIV